MVKCTVHGCPNRKGGGLNRGKTSKRFFSFPQDPGRVKVWLAALRETERDPSELSEICEDHFLPDHIMPHGISEDAIPLAPYLDGPVGTSESEDEQDEMPSYASAPVGSDDDDGEMDDDEEEDGEEEDDYDDDEAEGDGDDSLLQENEAKDVQKVQRSDPPDKRSTTETMRSKRNVRDGSRSDVSLGRLTRLFMCLLSSTPDGVLDLNDAALKLGTRKRRVYDVTNVLDGIRLVQKKSTSKIHWVSSIPISSFNGMVLKLQKEVKQLKDMEDTLDRLIRECSQHLFNLTDDQENAQGAYVTHEDLSRIPIFQGQTLIAIRAPEETKLDIPVPRKDGINMHLKGTRGPIHALACEMTTPTQEVEDQEKSAVFLTLEESRINTAPLKTASPSLPAPVQSA